MQRPERAVTATGRRLASATPEFASVGAWLDAYLSWTSAPVVDLGRSRPRRPSASPSPCAATVFREGHDQLSAEVVLDRPRPAHAARRCGWSPAATCPTATSPGSPPTSRAPGPSRSTPGPTRIATWEHDAGIKIPAGVDVELMFTEGRLLLERVAAGSASTTGATAASSAARSRPRRDTAAPGRRPASPRCRTPSSAPSSPPTRCASCVTVEGPFPFYADRDARALRQLVRVLPALRGRDPRRRRPARSPAAPSAPPPSGSTRWPTMGFDVIYLPPIHPIGEVNRKGPNNTLTPGPDDTGSPWAIGSKDGGHDAIHPDLGTFDDFDAFVARAAELGLEVALDLALQARARPPVGDHPPGVLHHPRRRHHRLRGEPAEEVPGHLPDQLRQRPHRHLPRGAADRPALDVPRRADLPRRQPPHQAGGVLGVAARARSAGPTPTCCSCPRRSPGRR